MTRSRHGTTRSVVYLSYLLAFGLLGGTVVVIFRGQSRYQESVEWAEHSYNVLDHATQLLVIAQRAEGSARGYALTGLAAYRQDAVVNLSALGGQVAALDSLVADNPEQETNLAAVVPLLQRRRVLVDSLVRLRDRDPRVTPATVSLVTQGSTIGFRFRRILVRMTEVERRLLSERQLESARRGGQTILLVLGGLGFALLIVAAAASLTFRELREREHAEERLQADAERQAVMIELQQAIATASADDPGVLDLIVDQVLHLTGAEGAALTFVDGDHHVARVARGVLVSWIGVRNPPADSLMGEVLASGEPEIVQDVWLDPRVDRRIADELGTRATAVMPIRDGTTPVGALVVASRRPNSLDPEHVGVLRIMSGILSAGITNAAAAEANQRLLSELRASRDAAEEANRSKSEFLATMSHELRTPLNSVIGFANLLLKNKGGGFSAGDLQFLARIRDNGTHLLELINDLLDVSKIEAGRMEVRPVPTDLAPLIRETVAQLEGQASPRGVELRVDAPEGLTSVDIDPARLKQVLINLIGNGLKFTEQGSVTVRLVGDGAGHPLRIDVLDTGIGIPADRLDAIFEAFTQADATTERRFGGTGLGLTISRSLLRMMGADLIVRSVLGTGSTFSVIFTRNAPEIPTPGSGSLLLIVDDDVHARQYLTALLGPEGYRLTTAREGRDGLAVLARSVPDLVLLDLKMPVMGGREFLHTLRRDPRFLALPVVIVTSLDLHDPEVAELRAEVAGVLSKGPGLEQALPALLRTLLRS